MNQKQHFVKISFKLIEILSAPPSIRKSLQVYMCICDIESCASPSEQLNIHLCSDVNKCIYTAKQQIICFSRNSGELIGSVSFLSCR